ncbi:MAG: hypothetical protein F6J94_02675 [Moorea sp. SIO1F2]|uniref:hypothetical protein n=1 Tax=unclassified Moorena TaxID=2683338 RepID=UPI0013BD75D0|nr:MULTISPECIES: hypothetical protein [unclassified Moorena]NEO18671.1 hypothetical protein [Moorena sp. SIO4A5]NEQ56072.1 hypothetical protein [Moorena sp. SIO4A1]NET80918.1 hypothetical protein [Moorena sp. SIO1F2]
MVSGQPLALLGSSRLPTPDSRLPTPDSRLPTPEKNIKKCCVICKYSLHLFT